MRFNSNTILSPLPSCPALATALPPHVLRAESGVTPNLFEDGLVPSILEDGVVSSEEEVNGDAEAEEDEDEAD